MRRAWLIAILAMLALAWSQLARAQEGAIEGVVHDAQRLHGHRVSLFHAPFNHISPLPRPLDPAAAENPCRDIRLATGSG